MILEKDVRLKLDEIRVMSKQTLRDQIHGRKVNPLLDADKLVSEYIFGIGTPLRFLKSYMVQDLQYASMKLSRTLDAYRYIMNSNSAVKECLNQLRRFTSENIFDEDGDGLIYKRIIKQWIKNTDLSFEEQFLHSFLLSIYVKVDDRVRDVSTRQYLLEFERDNNDKAEFVRQGNEQTLFERFARYVEGISSRQALSRAIPPTARSMSSVGRSKVFDQQELLIMLDTEGPINSHVRKHLITCFEAIQSFYGTDNSTIISRLQGYPHGEDTMKGVEFMPCLSFVPQNKGKISRPVFPSTDFSDLALDPFMKLLKQLMERLPSNYSRSSVSKQSMYSRVYMACRNAKAGIEIARRKNGDSILVVGEMEDIDSSNATERNSGLAQWELFHEIWSRLSDQFKSDLGVTEDYLQLVKELLLNTPFFYQLSTGEIGMSYSYGTTQGLKGSWDLLNWFTMMMILLSYNDWLIAEGDVHSEKHAIKLLTKSGHNGDDGFFLSDISEYIKQRISENSLDGVVSKDKSLKESEFGYMLFSSAYVRTSGMPKLSNIRITSLIASMSDPHNFREYFLDKFMHYQVMYLLNCNRRILRSFIEQYNCGQYTCVTDMSQLERAAAYSTAANAVRLAVLADAEVSNLIDIIPGADVGVNSDLTPSVRCRNVLIHNSNISHEKHELLMQGAPLEGCYYIDQTYSNQMMRELDFNYYEYVLSGTYTSLSDPYYDRLFRTYLAGEMCKSQILLTDKLYVSEDTYNKIYNFTNEGYKRDDQLISVTINLFQRR